MKAWKRINRSDRKKARFDFKKSLALMNEAIEALQGDPVAELRYRLNNNIDLFISRSFLAGFKRKTCRPVMTINNI